MNASSAPLPETQAERIRAVIAAAQDYAQAREAFDAASEGLERAHRQNCSTAGQDLEELDAAADAIGRTQAQVADLIATLVTDGSLETLSRLLAAEATLPGTPKGNGA
ncbi:hypothetical protein K3553_15060 [Leisingera aquaemixtae]|uniref:hypothetical protein n=1 Tax=Leisingera aquaemixtae TaxID=1396826 RepID=UPI0021A47E53|nr:hypothetical protein [Leisingera aquaemixtae]UWQ24263.1 hypothetical protein K3553_15060 [Leisingera aquaemixtae]